MKQLYWLIYRKYRKFEKPKISHLLEKTVFSVICSKCKNEYEKIVKEEDSMEILKILGLIENLFLYLLKISYFKNMAEENISQEFGLKNIDETRNYLIEEINRNELMTKKPKKVCTTLNYIEHFLILGSTITGCVSVSSFASLVCISIEITSSAVGLKISAITAEIKKYKSIIKKKKKHDKIVFLGKSK